MEIKEIQALIEENRKLAAQVKKLAAENAELSVQKTELEDTVSSLQAMMAWFRKRLYGKMSEKRLPLDPSVLEPSLLTSLYRKGSGPRWMRR